jgi:membrane associated rhomboid family serine protease
MFALWMFGYSLENIWGPRRFLIYYFLTGIGAALVQCLVIYIAIRPEISIINDLINNPQPEAIIDYFRQFQPLPQNITEAIEKLKIKPEDRQSIIALKNSLVELRNEIIDHQAVVIGASGAVFGILLAFGMIFPNLLIYLYFLFPIKAKYFVIGYGILELVSGLTGAESNVAHFAHLGGMIFGFFLILYWKKKGRLY